MAAVDSYFSPVDFRIGQTPPEGVPPESRAAFVEVYEGIQQVIIALLNNCGIGQQPPANWAAIAAQQQTSTLLAGNLNRLYVVALEAIAEGAAVSLLLSGGLLKVRNANATNNTKPADGFCTTAGGIAAGATGEIVLHSGVAIVAGLTIGTRYYLSLVNGLITNVAPVAAGNIEQYVGIAISTNILAFNLHYWIQH